MNETRSVLDLVELLIVSGGLSPETALRLSKEIDLVYGLSTRARGSTAEKREKWRAKKERQRARRRECPPGDRGDKTRSAIIEEIPYTSLSPQDKNYKSDSGVSPPSPGDKPKREKRSKGDVLPDDWKPTDEHYALGEKLGFGRPAVDDFADRMRSWAHANEHRQVARKSGTRGWNAAFSNWMRSAKDRINQNVSGGSNATNRNGASAARSGGGYSTLAAKLRHGARAARDAAGGEPGDGRPDPEPRLQLVDRSGEAPADTPAAHR